MEDWRHQILGLVREKGIVRPHDIHGAGVSSAYLPSLVREGSLRRLGRGLYALPNEDVTEHHTMVEAVCSQPRSVVCLLSALRFHELGTQIPHQTWLAVPYGTRIAKSETPAKRIVVLRPSSYEAGIEHHLIEGIEVPIYGLAKTVADCFKFRNKIGLDVALEALRDALRDRRCQREEIHEFARIDRVENLIRPYMEAMT